MFDTSTAEATFRRSAERAERARDLAARDAATWLRLAAGHVAYEEDRYGLEQARFSHTYSLRQAITAAESEHLHWNLARQYRTVARDVRARDNEARIAGGQLASVAPDDIPF